MSDDTQRVASITLDEHTVISRSPDIESERAAAIADLLTQNQFALASGRAGPFHLHLAVEENRLSMEVRADGDASTENIMLPLAPFRRIVKDYFLVCENYYKAIRTAPPHQIEALDMARRTLHDEGAVELQKRLKDKVETDFDTARRLFTLVCVLQMRG